MTASQAAQAAELLGGTPWETALGFWSVRFDMPDGRIVLFFPGGTACEYASESMATHNRPTNLVGHN